MNEKFEKILVPDGLVVKDAIRKMDETGEKILFVIDSNHHLKGSITDGDLRRWILKDGSLNAQIEKVYNKSPITGNRGDSHALLKEIMLEKRVDALPLLSSDGKLIDVVFKNHLFDEKDHSPKSKLDVPVFIMAGGKGTRLDPLTRILPKPLIPFGDKPIVEIIIDKFQEFGCQDFYLTLNYKGKMIQAYFDTAEAPYKVNFVWEEKPTGTAGSLKLAQNSIKTPHIFVSNCDILIKADYQDIYQFHIQGNHDVTMIGSVQHISVPFGVLEVKNGGTLQSITEKPEYDFLANTGFYLIKREIIDLIPDNTPFDFTQLILKVKESGGKVGVYPISQQSWVDIGQWQEFQNAFKQLEI